MTSRPRINIPLKGAVRIIDITGYLTLTLLWLFTFICFARLPETIPIHYNGEGQIDGYGNRITIFVLPSVATVLFAGITLLNRYPHIFNYATKITAANAAEQYILATRFLSSLKLSVVLVFSFIVFTTVRAAMIQYPGTDNWFLPVLTASALLPFSFFLLPHSRRIFHRKKENKG